MKGRNDRIVLEGEDDLLIEKLLKFEFKACNNQAEYEALIISMSLTLELGASTLKANSCSQMEEKQDDGEYQ